MGVNISQPELHTERLILGALALSDEDAIFAMRTTADMIVYTDSKLDDAIEETRSYIQKMNQGIAEGKWYIWAIKDCQTHQFMGSVSLWNFNEQMDTAELGYGIMPQFQKKGYMQEAIKAVMAFGYETLQLKCIEAYTEASHLASIKLLGGLGFTHIQTIEEPGYYSNRIFNMAVFKRRVK